MSLARAEADLAQAKVEVRRYETLLDAARQRATKLEHYIELARQYAGLEGDEHAEDAFIGRRRPRSGISGDAVNAVITILRDHKRPIPTRELVALLKDRGIVLGGPPDREITNLSGYLSRAPELASDRVQGWRLVTWDDDARASSTSFSRTTAASPDDASAAEEADAASATASQFFGEKVASESDDQNQQRTRGGWDKPKSADLDDDIPF